MYSKHWINQFYISPEIHTASARATYPAVSDTGSRCSRLAESARPTVLSIARRLLLIRRSLHSDPSSTL